HVRRIFRSKRGRKKSLLLQGSGKVQHQGYIKKKKQRDKMGGQDKYTQDRAKVARVQRMPDTAVRANHYQTGGSVVLLMAKGDFISVNADGGRDDKKRNNAERNCRRLQNRGRSRSGKRMN